MRVIEIKKFFKGHLMNLITEQYITVNGPKMAIEMEKELRYGKMAVNLSDIGEMTKLTGKEDLFMQTVMCMKATGSMTKLKVEEHTSIWMVPSTWENGEKIVNTATALKAGLIMQSMKETTNMERNTASVLSNGVTALHTSVNSIIIIFMEKVSTLGLTTEFTKVNGVPTKCMAKERLLGQTGVNTLENTLKTRNVDMENSSGQMVDVIEVNGLMANNTGKELT